MSAVSVCPSTLIHGRRTHKAASPDTGRFSGPPDSSGSPGPECAAGQVGAANVQQKLSLATVAAREVAGGLLGHSLLEAFIR
jgi:hypothetical protein